MFSQHRPVSVHEEGAAWYDIQVYAKDRDGEATLQLDIPWIYSLGELDRKQQAKLFTVDCIVIWWKCVNTAKVLVIESMMLGESIHFWT